jgi:hypothetical protein
VSCSAGKYASLTGATSCLNCSSGTYSAEQSSACILCAAGKHSSAVGAHSCIDCKPGLFSQPGYLYCLDANVFRGKSIEVVFQEGADEAAYRKSRPLPFKLSFGFSIFCAKYTNITMYSNGLLAFEKRSIAQVQDQSDPCEAVYKIGVSAFGTNLGWTDLSDRFLARMSQNESIFLWSYWSDSDGNALTFQISLFRNSSILMSYLIVDGNSDSGAHGHLPNVGIAANGSDI